MQPNTSTVPQIQIGKALEEPLHIKHMLPLPADTPFGNLSLKYTRIVERLDHVNLSIQKAFTSYDEAKARDLFGGLTEHALLTDEAIYWLRKTADELIGLLYVLAQRESTGSYPNLVDPDSIGDLFASKFRQRWLLIPGSLRPSTRLLTRTNIRS